jgi:hypothetical protein
MKINLWWPVDPCKGVIKLGKFGSLGPRTALNTTVMEKIAMQDGKCPVAVQLAASHEVSITMKGN